MRRIQKYLSGLCAAALLLSLLLAGTAKADEITIYLMAEKDQMLDLPLSAMPAWINGDIYVPYTAFDWTVTGVNLGVSYGQERTETEYKFTLYSLNGMLVFDLNAGTCTDGFSGEAKDMRAALRNGRVFVPLAGVCSFFGLNYTYTPTNYGTLIRITNGQERLDTQQFVTSASGLSMPTRYYKYLQELNQGTQPTPSPSPTPSGGGTDEPEQEDGLPVYLSFQCTGGGALDNILDTLEARATRWACPSRARAWMGRGRRWRRGPACWSSWSVCGPIPYIWRGRPPAWRMRWSGRAGPAGRPTWTAGPTAEARAPRPTPCCALWKDGAARPACCWTTAERAPESCPGCCPACRGTRTGSNWRWIPGSERIGAHTGGRSLSALLF